MVSTTQIIIFDARKDDFSLIMSSLICYYFHSVCLHLCLNLHIDGMDANPFHPQCLLAKEYTDGGDWYIDGEDGDDDTIVHIVAVLVASSHCRRKYFL